MVKIMQGIKRKRSVNWEENEKIVLKDCIGDKLSIIDNKLTDNFTNTLKRNAWKVIHERFNMFNSRARSLPELQVQWRNCKLRINANKNDAQNIQSVQNIPSVQNIQVLNSEEVQNIHVLNSEEVQNIHSVPIVQNIQIPYMDDISSSSLKESEVPDWRQQECDLHCLRMEKETLKVLAINEEREMAKKEHKLRMLAIDEERQMAKELFHFKKKLLMSRYKRLNKFRK